MTAEHEFLVAARAQIENAPEPRATPPGSGADALRHAYLSLLRLAVCDMVGPGTTSVGALDDGTVMARELRGDERRIRAAGLDWPLHGLTMVGLQRLADLQGCVERLVADAVPGDIIEAGSWRGGASMLMRATLDSLGDDRTVWVADSFQGFPPDDPGEGGLPLATYDFLTAPLDEVRASFARLGLDRGVRFVPGFFDATLPALPEQRWALVRLDADTYAPTRLALQCLYPQLAPGGYLILDDYGAFPGCRRAVDEFRAEHGIAEPVERVDATCARWRRTSDAPVAVPRPGSAPARPPAPPTTSRHVPTAEEASLAAELERLRDQLAAAEAEVGLRPWLWRRVGRLRRR